MTSTRPAHLAAGDVRARHSRLQVDDGRARRAMATMSDGRMILVADVKRFRQRINASGRNEGPNPCEMQIGLTADSLTQAQLRLLANTPVQRWPTITLVLDPGSRTEALAGCCVQLRRHPPRGPRCQPRPQPPATATTWLVSSAAFAMAAPLAALASAFDAPSAPTPTATMAAASNARIWLSCFLADTLGRATD